MEERHGGSNAGPFTFAVVLGPCDPEGKCAQGKCEKLQVCVPPTPAASEGEPADEGKDEAPAGEADEPAAPAGDVATEVEEESETKGCHVGAVRRVGVSAALLILLTVAGVVARQR